MLKMVKQIAKVYSEPFADSSQLPTMLLSKFARKHAKVVLSGDGADEFFGGYNRYYKLNSLCVEIFLFLSKSHCQNFL